MAEHPKNYDCDCDACRRAASRMSLWILASAVAAMMLIPLALSALAAAF